jgi:magnesium-transporting ATPase (P-type)
VAGGLFASRHDSIKRTLAQVHRYIMSDIHIAVIIIIIIIIIIVIVIIYYYYYYYYYEGLEENARMDLMISEPRRGQITPIDVGFVSASVSVTVAAAAKNPDAATSRREGEKVRRSVVLSYILRSEEEIRPFYYL